MVVKHEIYWCIQKLEEALASSNVADEKAYTELLKMWLNKSK